ncbi:MAG: alanine--tRNA ligase [Thermoprotei archaeon]|nr:MAG: alanine--tRNA ligase [Thermoprotei archaeon]
MGDRVRREEFLRLPFFRERGFTLKKCRVCGSEFWTLDPDRDVCGDQPCVDYEFIGRPLRGAASPREVRERFLRFFEEEGHTRVGRYPVVARWRDDVYLVGASIYDFQPWVTEGLVEPPANPLVISQPSIRLTDLDNVGRTGRHMTGFEMMAHHAFNIGGRNVYWANETVEYAFRVLTEAFNIPPEEITFKFDWWSGGGNAGEDYEVLVRGLEVATLVFMHYKVVDDRLVEMGNRIVDTGYGLERLLWLFRGSPTIYDAVFPRVLDALRREAGLEQLDPAVLEAVARKSGKLDFKKPALSVRVLDEISRELGVERRELEKMLMPYQSLYALADHSRTIFWMIGDGVVPSNVGAGYLARLLIRRALRHMARAGLDIPLAEVVSMQLKAWRDDFPEYAELEGEILDIVSYEERRYQDALRHGKRVVRKLLRELVRRGLREVPPEKLSELYESHGVAPELVAEEAARVGVRVVVPPDFYSSLASKHEVAPPKPAAIEEARKLAEGLPPTRRLYYEDPRRLEFKARVLRTAGRMVVLDSTAFYPEGGGQPHDTGVLEWEGGKCRVVRVIKVGDVVLHECEGQPPPEGAEVKGVVDAERRFALMRNHTATHIILGAARRVLGRHVWQAGAQKGVEQSRLDITHHKRISPEEIRAIEELANKVVMEDRPVRVFFEDRTVAESKYGFILYQGGVVPEARLRIVEVEGWDVEACGGLHCSRTGEVGLIKVVKVERIQDGVSRLVFKVGRAALEHVWRLEDSVSRLAHMLNVEEDKVVEGVEQLVSELRVLRRSLEKARRELLELKAAHLAAKAEQVAGIKLVVEVVEEGEERDVRDLALAVARQLSRSIVGLVNRGGVYAIKVGDELVEEGFDARELNKLVLARVEGRGGGVADLVMGRVSDPSAFREALREVVVGVARDEA